MYSTTVNGSSPLLNYANLDNFSGLPLPKQSCYLANYTVSLLG